MNLIIPTCLLFLWMQTLTFVKSQPCTSDQFINGPQYDDHFDTTTMVTTYAAGTQLRVLCKVGFSGFFRISCVGGNWEYKGSRCKAKSCGHPGDAPFANFHLEKGKDFVFGSQVEYTCHKGYQMQSSRNYRICMDRGWDGNMPVCEAIGCPALTLANNIQVNGDAFEATYGNVVQFSCKSSREILDGSSEIYCNEKGVWSGPIPLCKEIKCSPPIIENGYPLGHLLQYNENEILHYACNSGYIRTEARPSKCTKIGSRAEWTPIPMCDVIVCTVTLPPVEGTTYEPAYKNVFQPRETLRVICEERFWIFRKQDTTVDTTCKEDGEWSTRPVCKVVTCSDQQDRLLSYWSIRWRHQIRLGSTARYSCVENYKKPEGTDLAKCTRDGWIPNPFCEEILCDKMEIPNAVIENIHKQKYKNNEIAYYNCKDGYEGHPSPRCGENGWSIFSPCKVTTCYGIHEYTYAVLDGVAKVSYRNDETIHYFCITPFVGRFSLTCERGGWIGRSQCRRGRQCEKTVIEDAYITHDARDHYEHNDKVQYACLSNRDIKFEAICDDGKWSWNMSCSECQTPEIPNGYAVGPFTNKTYYSCNEGYKLFSKGWWGEATCNNLQWTGLGKCIEMNQCGEIPEILNGNMAVQDKVYQQDSSIKIICNEGYKAEVEDLNCEDGNWRAGGLSLEEICKPLKGNCEPPHKFDNSVLLPPYRNKYVTGSEATYRCRHEFEMEGEATLRCNNGEWEQIITCTKIKCSPPIIENGYPLGHLLQYNENEILHYACNSGYIRTEARPSKCTKIGSRAEWTPIPMCDVIVCTVTLPPVEGTTYEPAYKNVFQPRETLRVICEERFWIFREQDTTVDTTCKEDGEWSIRPVCKALKGNCEPPHEFNNAVLLPPYRNKYMTGSEATYRCRHEYEMEGEATLRCNNAAQPKLVANLAGDPETSQ